jgi:hypothetical protein
VTRTSVALRLTFVWAVAASILVVAFALGQAPPHVPERVVPSDGWGWARPKALPQDLSREDYLHRLADAAGEWFHIRPEGPEGLARQLGEFRQSCSIVILSDHRPLSREDQAWLAESCREWAARIEGGLIALEAGGDPSIIRRQVDATIEEAMAKLRKHSRSD